MPDSQKEVTRRFMRGTEPGHPVAERSSLTDCYFLLDSGDHIVIAQPNGETRDQ